MLLLPNRSRFAVPIVCLLAWLTVAAPVRAQAAGGSEPVPKALDQGKVDRQLREKYKADFGSQDPAVRGALAHQLRELADKDADYVEKFVYLREARELATGAGDIPYVMEVIDDMAGIFAINAQQMKLDAVAAAVDQARVSPVELAQNYLKVADAALAEWNLDLAHSSAAMAMKMAGRNQELHAGAKERDRIYHLRRQILIPVLQAERQLVTMPDDARLNQTVGVYFCFTRDNWETGLPYLAKSQSPELKLLAEKDAAGPQDAAAIVAVASAWWEFADAKLNLPAGSGHRRAAYWYQKALPKLTGQQKLEAEKRIAEAAR